MTLREEILDRLNIIDLVGKYVTLKKTGRNRVGLCPFHKENTPSFTVSEEKQIFKCFGCGKGGNAITFHMEIERLDYRESITQLAQEQGIDVTKYQKNPDQTSKEHSQREKLKLLNKRTQSFFRQQLTPSSQARSYLIQKRGLSESIIEQFGVGYAPDSHFDLITHLKQKGFTTGEVIDVGLAKKGQQGDAYAFFRDRITYPIFNHAGSIVGFAGRALQNDQQPKYLNTTETALYDKSKILYGLNIAKQHLTGNNALIVVEGYMDVIALAQYGLPHGIATCGTALTPEHTKLLKRYCENLIFAFDQDQAGFDATVRGLKVAYRNDLFPKVFQFPQEFKDIDEYLHASDQKISLEDMLASSQDGFQFVLKQLQKRYDFQNPVERKKSLQILFEILSAIEDYSILLMYLDQIGLAVSTNRQLLLKQFKTFLKTNRVASTTHETGHTREELTQVYLVSVLCNERFIHSLGLETVSIEQLSMLVQDVATQINTMVVITENASEHDQQKINEAQLRREHHLESLPKDKQLQHIHQFLKKHLHTLQRQLIKADLPHETKQNLLDKIRRVK